MGMLGPPHTSYIWIRLSETIVGSGHLTLRHTSLYDHIAHLRSDIGSDIRLGCKGSASSSIFYAMCLEHTHYIATTFK
ncbi:hypothetical protein QE152_g23368 [Popillia japonica]|uniref:Uncharacterized protein n=1 Tax=Popillia japonica TaxID=7064 RepID=A0AAW1KI42_POPJA